MLPSTFEGQSSKDKKAKTLRATRKDVSDFLRQTLKETGLPISAENARREEFSEFFRKVRLRSTIPSTMLIKLGPNDWRETVTGGHHQGVQDLQG